MTDYQSQVENYITQNYPDATVGDVLGKKEIITKDFPLIPGTLPFRLVEKKAIYSDLPDNIRHKINFKVIKDLFDELSGTPVNITKSLPELAGKKITLSYSPATQADEDVINSYLPNPHADGTPIDPGELPNSLPAYLVNLKPELRINGEVIAIGTVVGMGNTEEFSMNFTAPNMSSDLITNNIEAGEYLGIGLDLGRISQKQINDLKTKLKNTQAKLDITDFTNITKDELVDDLLYSTALSYYARLDLMDLSTAKIIGVAAIRLPSETIFSYELHSDKFFGSPISTSARSLSMDLDRAITLVKAVDGEAERTKQFMYVSGENSSALEQAVPELIFSTQENPAQGISAVTALKIANDRGIPIYTINRNNIDTILPMSST